jgi:hypothetical protein
LNSAYACLRADAITGSRNEAPALCGELGFFFLPIFSPAGHSLVTNECLNFK